MHLFFKTNPPIGIQTVCAKGRELLLKSIWEGQCYYPFSEGSEAKPCSDAQQWKNPKQAVKWQEGCPSCPLLHLVQGRRKSGGCQWDHPHCAWFLVMDLAVTSSHTQTMFALQTHSVSESRAKELALLHPPKRSSTHLGDQQGFYLLGIPKKHPHPDSFIVH